MDEFADLMESRQQPGAGAVTLRQQLSKQQALLVSETDMTPAADYAVVREGRQYLRLKGDRARIIQAKQVFSVIKDTPLDGVLRKQPIKEYFVAGNIEGAHGEKLAGIYFYDEQRLGVSYDTPAGPYNGIFDPGNSRAVLDAAKDQVDYMQRTLVHELGHHLYGIASKDLRSSADKAFNKAKQAGQLITTYAGKSRTEYLSECLAAYTYHEEELKAFDLDGHALVELFLKELGS